MTPEDEALLTLVARSFGAVKVNTVLREDVDWNKVLRLAYEHKVSMLVTGLDDKQFAKGYYSHLSVVETLCGIFRSHGLIPVVLKGLSLAENYPVSFRRGIGDLDIFLIDKDGKCAAKEGDRILGEMTGMPVEDDVQYHSSFRFRKVVVENHHELISRRYEGENYDKLRSVLCEKTAEHCCGCCENRLWAELPPDVNAVFLMMHLRNHFVNKVTCGKLRQYTDWIQFLRRHYDEVDWEFVKGAWNDLKISRFAAGANGFVTKYLGCEPELCVNICDDENLMEVYVQRIMHPSYYDGKLLNWLSWYHINREWIEYVYGKSWWRVMMEDAWIRIKQ